jgi:hypothetical protein
MVSIPFSHSGKRLWLLTRSASRLSSGVRRHHDVAHLEIHQPEDVLGELVLPVRDVTRARGQGQDAPDLLPAVGRLVTTAGRQAHCAQHPVRDAVHGRDERPEHDREGAERKCGAQRRTLCAPERPHLRRLLPERHVQRRDDCEGETDRHDREPRGRCLRPIARGCDPGQDQLRDRRLTQRTEDQARECDAELATGQVSIEMLQDVLGGPCPGAALLGQLGDARPPHLHQGELRGHEEAVQEHEEEGRPQPPGDPEGGQTGVGFVH